MKTRLILFATIALLACGNAIAQNVVDLNLTARSSSGSAIPTLTWSNPTASTCTASGDAAWTGVKPVSGTATLASVPPPTGRSYTLNCTWPGGSTSAIVSWTAPTTNVDGSALTNLGSFRVVYGRTATDLDTSLVLDTPTARTTTIQNLAAGQWFFAVRAANTLGIESALSNIATKTIVASGGSASKTVGFAFPGTSTLSVQ
jgi:hypothetical protein